MVVDDEAVGGRKERNVLVLRNAIEALFVRRS